MARVRELLVVVGAVALLLRGPAAPPTSPVDPWSPSEVAVDGVQLGWSPALVELAKGRPDHVRKRDWWEYGHTVVWFRHGAVVMASGDRLSRRGRTLLYRGDPVSEMAAKLGDRRVWSHLARLPVYCFQHRDLFIEVLQLDGAVASVLIGDPAVREAHMRGNACGSL